MSNENFEVSSNKTKLIHILRNILNEKEALGVTRLADGGLAAQVVFTDKFDDCLLHVWTLDELASKEAKTLATEFMRTLISKRNILLDERKRERIRQEYSTDREQKVIPAIPAEHLARLPKSIKCDWVKMGAEAMFENGDVLLVAVPVVVKPNGVASLAFLETRLRANEWQYEFSVVTVDCDEDRFRLETHDKEPFGWDVEDVECYVKFY